MTKVKTNLIIGGLRKGEVSKTTITALMSTSILKLYLIGSRFTTEVEKTLEEEAKKIGIEFFGVAHARMPIAISRTLMSPTSVFNSLIFKLNPFLPNHKHNRRFGRCKVSEAFF